MVFYPKHLATKAELNPANQYETVARVRMYLWDMMQAESTYDIRMRYFNAYELFTLLTEGL